MFEVVTTFNQEKHAYFSDKMLKSFDKFWSKSINLYAYVEKQKQNYNFGNNIIIKDFNDISDKFNLFEFNYKSKEANAPFKSYKFEAIKFAHKIFTISAHLKECVSRYLIWLDSDVITINKIDENFLLQFVKTDTYFSYLGREYINFHSEAGFMIFDRENDFHDTFWNEIENMYVKGKLFNEKEWHDSYIFDVVRERLEKKNMKCLNISDLGLTRGINPMEVMDNSKLGKCLRHLKGKRKNFAKNI